ncbi:hypothetical protein FJ365_03780 [Candidatus Dependentiae bacterium]|nr:hypothetical protein [Candidatus Dependentiae bacterium]
MKKPFPFYILWFVLSVFILQIDAATCDLVADTAEEATAAYEITNALSSLLKHPVPLTDEAKIAFAGVLFKHRKLVSLNRELREKLQKSPHKYVELVREQCEVLAGWEANPDGNKYKCCSIQQILNSNLEAAEKATAIAELHCKSQTIKENIEQAIADHIQTVMGLYASYTPVIPRRVTPIVTATPPLWSGQTPTRVSPFCLGTDTSDEDTDSSTAKDDGSRSSASVPPVSRETSPARWEPSNPDLRLGASSFSKYVRTNRPATDE